MKQKTVVELFAGIGGFRLACEELGLNTVWANDIDETAASVYCDNFGKKSFLLGNIQQLKTSIPKHDILTAGFPCQPFSKAGYKKGIEDYRGTLFEDIVDVLKNRQPEFFILENVSSILYLNNGKHYQTIINALTELDYKVEWKTINAVDFGLPQNRERIIMIGSLSKDTVSSYMVSAFEESSFSDIDKERINNYFLWSDVNNVKRKFSNWGMAYKGKYCSFTINTTRSTLQRLTDVLQNDVDSSYDFTLDTIKRIEKSKYVGKYVNGVQILYNQAGGARMGYTIFGINGIAPTLTATSSRHYERYQVDDKYRRLTNIEYARLQGFPDNHCRAVTPYKQYKLYGNALPPQLAKWSLELVTNGVPRMIEKPLSLYDLLEVNYG